ncbi:aminotransferase class IV [Actinotalea fermentans]|uniref:4-amino-4-deoxychorismate lyase n=1 Tax=Actinotalea fermentans TaxID=43671 RepID=A0A511YUD4_9CELL|nr:aminotransferase class IV [Actinotalea fermentans]GEN78807.1 4-amino-4-deoxychorismate lyase [Actinotalea fermentans]
MGIEGTVAWVNGRLRDPAEPVLSALDHGLTVGDGVFETCGVVQGRAFALTRHLRRLQHSALGIGLPAPDEALLRDAVAQVLAAGTGLGRLRITVTAGLGPLGSGRIPGEPTVIVLAGPANPPDVVRVVRVPWVRNERSAVAGLKTTSYVENAVALAHAQSQGADEALLANTVGELCEGTGTNVFVERDGEVLTPPLSSGCLGGITRELVLEWGAQAGLPVREALPGELPYTVLDDVAAGRAQLGLTGSVRTVAPVVALDGAAVTTGPLVAELRALYAAREPQDVDP